MPTSMSEDTWTFITISAKTVNNRMEFSAGYCSPCTDTLTAGYTLQKSIGSVTPITNRSIIIGAGKANDVNSTFSGSLSELRIFQAYHSLEYV